MENIHKFCKNIDIRSRYDTVKHKHYIIIHNVERQ